MVLVFKGTGLFSSVFTSLGEAADLNSRLDVLPGIRHKHTVLFLHISSLLLVERANRNSRAAICHPWWRLRADVVVRDGT